MLQLEQIPEYKQKVIDIAQNWADISTQEEEDALRRPTAERRIELFSLGISSERSLVVYRRNGETVERLIVENNENSDEPNQSAFVHYSRRWVMYGNTNLREEHPDVDMLLLASPYFRGPRNGCVIGLAGYGQDIDCAAVYHDGRVTWNFSRKTELPASRTDIKLPERRVQELTQNLDILILNIIASPDMLSDTELKQLLEKYRFAS